MITNERIKSTLNKFKQALESHPEIREFSYFGLQPKYPYEKEKHMIRPTFLFQSTNIYGIDFNSILSQIENSILFSFAMFREYEWTVTFQVDFA